MNNIFKKYRVWLAVIIAAAVIAGAVIGGRALYVRSFGKALFPAYLPGPYSSLESDMLFADEMTGSAARPNYRELDFARSKIISPKGFGFKRQFTFDERTAVSMDVSGSSRGYVNNYTYGIYKDELLMKPVSEKNTKGESDAAMADEMGIDYDYGLGLSAELEPGTYYIGICIPAVRNTPMITEYSLEFRELKLILKEAYQGGRYEKQNNSHKHSGSFSASRYFWHTGK